MANSEEVEIRLQAMEQLLSQSDIDEIYASDQATFEKIKSRADTQVSSEIDEAVSTFLAEYDIDIVGTDLAVIPVFRVLFGIGRVEGWKLKQNVLATEVKKWIIRGPTASLGLSASPPSIYQSSCHECDERFDEKRYICPSCGTLLIER